MKILIYTDGSSRGNPGPGGYGILMQVEGTSYIKEFSEGFRKTTNNRMELLAIIVALEKLTKEKQQVLITTDSKYVVNAVEKKWVLGWEKKQFKGKKNPDLWVRFLKVYRKHKVSFQWVKGHNHHPQNERCDFLAVQASKKEVLKIDHYYENLENLNSHTLDL
ncbi:ribonuclease H [Flavobacteriaceae bacterium UJ101]|nr:ribonuclease H [Flavobacteriaceae bacterium UJ101]